MRETCTSRSVGASGGRSLEATRQLRFSEDEALPSRFRGAADPTVPGSAQRGGVGRAAPDGLVDARPHLNNENLGEVLARAKHRTKKEIAQLVCVLDPLPAAPARIESLGPAPARLVPKTPAWSEFMQSFCLVRELSAVNARETGWTPHPTARTTPR
jgi:hypothetical protein